MDKLLAYLNSLGANEREDFATRSGTSVGYIRKACSIGQQIGADLCIELERESGGAVRCEDLRSDVDWQFLRASGVTANKRQKATA